MIESGKRSIGPDVALRVGQSLSIEKMGVCGGIFESCRDLEEVAHQFIRYQRILYAICSFEFRKGAYTATLSCGIKNPNLRMNNRLLTELAFSSIIGITRSLIKESLNPQEVHFEYDKPKYVEKYENMFCSPLLFGQKENAIVFRKADLKFAVSKDRQFLKEILVTYANGFLERLETSGQLKEEVQKLAMEFLPKGNVDIEMISGKLNMSRWTLARKLKKEGLTFRALINSLKKELALNYLENRDLPIGEIAFLLGYSEIRAFRRAFKNWTGKNPYGFRRESNM